MHNEKKQNWYVNPKKYHFIYKTTCQVNGKYYYGMHSTDDLEDGYIGSGTRLWHSIKKYGRENFKIEILEFCSDRESLKKREAELITEDVLAEPMCMNLKLGGEGGWEFCNKGGKPLHLTEDIQKRGGDSFSKKMKFDKEFKHKFCKNLSKFMIDLHSKKKLKTWGDNCNWTDKHHSNETKKKISESQKGKQSGIKNSQHNTCWVYHLELKICKKIQSTEIETYLDKGYIKGRKMKF